jgi:gliding motility-associated-like protein
MRKGILLLAMLFVALLGQAQLVLNEVSQGPSSSSKEYMEFVVVGTRTCTDSTADLRGWIVDDNNGWVEAGSGQGIAAGAIRFANVANWSKVPYGSIIVIYNEDDKNTKITIADDPTDANHDYVYVMAASSPQLERNFTAPAAPSSASFTYPTTGWGQGTAADWHWGTVALANSGDAIITVKPTNLSSAHFSFAFTTGSAATATVWVADMPGGKNYSNTTANYTQAASWVQGDAGVNETPGVPNGGANTTWINSMRVQATGSTAGTLTSSNGTVLCTGATTTLSSSIPGGTWTSGSPAVVGVTAAGAATAASPGTATLTYTVTSGGCTSTATLNITVTALANAGTISGGPNVCTGQTVTYSSNGTAGGTWSSANTAIATVNPITGVVTPVAAGSSSIIYTIGSGACAATASAPVNVTTTPVVAPITGNNTVCVGSQVTLSSATSGGNWNTSDPGIVSLASAGGTATATGVAPGTATITYTVTNGSCTAQQTFTITVNPLPAPVLIAGPSTVCTGNSITLTGTPAGGIWTSSNTAAATIDPNTGVVNGLIPGGTVITYTASNGTCANTATANIGVLQTPILQPTTGPNTLCLPGQVVLTNPAVNGSGTWTATPSGIVTLAPSIVTGGPSMVTVTGVSAGTVTITFSTTSNVGCTGTMPFTLTVSASTPVTPITGANTVCLGSTTTFSSATAGGTWSSANSAVAPVSTGGVITGQSAGTTTITYTVGGGSCPGKAQKDISVIPPPVVGPITGTPSVCVGQTTTLSNSSAGVNTWSSSNPLAATVSSTGVVTGISAGTSVITFTIVNAEGCTASTPITVTVSAPPVLGPIVGGGNLCTGTTTNLAHPTAGGTWSSNNTAVATVSSAGIVTAVSNGNATISYTVTNGGCSAAVNTVINVTTTPNPGPITGNTGLCLGATSTLSGSLPGGTWSSNNPVVATVNAGGVVSALSTGTTQIAYTVNNNGCTGVATVNVNVQDLNLQLAVSPNPATAGQAVTFTSSANIPYVVTAWGPVGAIPSNTATTQTISAQQSGEYFVIGTAGGCIDTARVNLVVNTIADDLFVPNYFTPNGDGRNDVLYIYGSNLASIDFRIFNQWGETVFSTGDKGHGWDGVSSGKAQPVGVYMYVARVTLVNGTQKTIKGSINLIR